MYSTTIERFSTNQLGVPNSHKSWFCLVTLPSLPTDHFERLQYAKTKGEDLGTFLTYKLCTAARLPY